MDNGTELIAALSQIASEKGIAKEIILEALETSLVSACKKQLGPTTDIKVVLDEKTGKMQVLALKEVVEEVTDPGVEMTLEEAQAIKPSYNIGDVVEMEVTPRNFGRISAQTAKQVVVQKFREAEREILFNEYKSKEGEIVTGIVERRDRRNVIINVGKLEATLAPADQIPREYYNFQDRLKVYVQDVKLGNKGPMVSVSRVHPDLIKRLFEQEVPEVYDGTVEVRAVAREPGNRSKVAVYSRNPHVDPVGACVGPSGYRVNIISNELRGEKLDLIPFSNDPLQFIASALAPSKITTVAINPETNTAKVIVPDNQLSLAIGREGQNVRLAAKLTGWRIDIKGITQAEAMDFITPEELEVDYDAYLRFKKAQEEKEASRLAEEAAAMAELAGTEAKEAPDDYYDDEYYDDEYYDDDYEDYYDDDYDDDEYYDDEDENKDKPEAEHTS